MARFKEMPLLAFSPRSRDAAMTGDEAHNAWSSSRQVGVEVSRHAPAHFRRDRFASGLRRFEEVAKNVLVRPAGVVRATQGPRFRRPHRRRRAGSVCRATAVKRGSPIRGRSTFAHFQAWAGRGTRSSKKRRGSPISSIDDAQSDRSSRWRQIRRCRAGLRVRRWKPAEIKDEHFGIDLSQWARIQALESRPSFLTCPCMAGRKTIRGRMNTGDTASPARPDRSRGSSGQRKRRSAPWVACRPGQ